MEVKDENNKLSMQVHFMRPIRTSDVFGELEDLQLELGTLVGA